MLHLTLLIIIFFCFIALALVLILQSVRSKRKGLSYLYLSLLSSAAYVVVPIVILLKLDLTIVTCLSVPLKVLPIPLYYLFLKKIGSTDKSLKKGEYLHFLPVLVELVASLIIVPFHVHDIWSNINIDAKEYNNLFIDGNPYYNILSGSSRIIAFIQSVVYVFIMFKIYRKYSLTLKRETSVVSLYDLKWIELLLAFMIMNIIVWSMDVFSIHDLMIKMVIGGISQVVLGLFYIIIAVKQPDISYIEGMDKQYKIELENSFVSIDHHDFESFLSDFQKKEYFLQAGLSLNKLSDDMGVPKHKITKMITNSAYKNFNNLVNLERVEYSKKLLREMDDSFTIDSIGESSGFNSRATFYRVFKDITGLTPKRFLEKLAK